ncbi:MAG: ABC transporter ATP-binding protein [Gemmataceae bacterium]
MVITPEVFMLAILGRDLHKSFRTGSVQTPILRGVGLGIARGETVFLVGPSGSGKTTLLSIIGCLLSADEGTVEILGQNVSRMNTNQLTAFRRQHLAFVFQTFNLFPTLSALDNVRLTLCMRGTSLTEASARALDLLGQVNLSQRVHSKPAQLSSGECQRVAVARALAVDPDIVFADEPTAALDAENGQVVLQLLTDLVKQHRKTLVVVTHDERIFPFADRILRLENGRLTQAFATEAEKHALALSSMDRRLGRRRQMPLSIN